MARSIFRGSIGFSWSARFVSRRRIAMYAAPFFSSPFHPPDSTRNDANPAKSLDHEAWRSLRRLRHSCHLHHHLHGVSRRPDHLAPSLPNRRRRLPDFRHPRRSLSLICSHESAKRCLVHALPRCLVVEHFRPLALWQREPMACGKRR